MTTAILALIALALALPWTRIGQCGEGRAVMHLIYCCHGCCCWRHLCPHSRDDGAKDNGHSKRRCRNANIHGWEEVGHHNLIGVEQQKQKHKQKSQLPNHASPPPLYFHMPLPKIVLLLYSDFCLDTYFPDDLASHLPIFY
jgi:hypothetical protein